MTDPSPERSEDVTDDLPDADHDPVVRSPRHMAVLPPEPPGPGLRTVLAVGLIAAALGATLGAVGIGIVYATHPPQTRASRHTRARAQVNVSERPRESLADALPIALDHDAGTPRPAALQPSRYDSRQMSMGRGRTLAGVLRSLGLQGTEPLRVTNALRVFVNMHTLQPGDVVCAMRDRVTHALERVEYRRGATQVWAAVHTEEGGFRAEQVTVTLSTVRVVAAFRVANGSVEASARAVGLNPEIVARVADAFVAINLSVRLHGGDTLRLVVDEERINGEFFRYGRVLAMDYQGAMGRRRAFWVGPSTRNGDYFDASGQTFERGPLRAPVPGARISSRFDPRRMHPVLHVIKPHNGVDFAASSGTAVLSAAEGVIASVGYAGPSGNLVRVSHPALGIETGYAHLSRFAPGLRSGQRVRAQQLLGYVGTTGRSTGPHLHFSVKLRGHFIDPLSLYSGRRSVPGALRASFETNSGLLGADLDRAVLDGPSTANGQNPQDPTATPTAPENPAGEEISPQGADDDEALDEGEEAQ